RSSDLVETDVCLEEGTIINRGFFLRITEGRPLITLKLATALDGKIATRFRDSRWITGEAARTHAHRLRAEHDAVLIGSETAIADDPELTCRLPGLEPHTPIRIVLDSRLRISPNSKLIQSAWVFPLWIVTAEGQDREAIETLQRAGAEVIELPAAENGRPDIRDVVTALAARGLTRLLVEGGGGVAGSFIKAGLVDDIVWFRAPKLIGGDGIPALASIGVERISKAPTFSLVETFRAGEDSVETYRRAS
ncbi:MAG: bifunctional diaminohydroxyphosphoribosylaminopyrimidine deaminase/5-amino-6-(5-phosphoribosylamino)uracil reductase RibD, partial [Rhodospirillales bacterium]